MRRPRVKVNFSTQEIDPWCWGCRANRHKDCELHINDGAVDAEEFLFVRCGCPCEGRIYSGDEWGPPAYRLIDLVADLQELANQNEKELHEERQHSADGWRFYYQAEYLLRTFLEDVYDDEGQASIGGERFLGSLSQGHAELVQEVDRWEQKRKEEKDGDRTEA